MDKEIGNVDKEVVNLFLEQVKEEDELKDDDDMLRRSDIASMKSHNSQFNSLLQNYVENSKNNLKRKLFLKTVFFWICLSILFLLFIFFVGVCIYSLKNNVSTESLIPILVTNLISFLTSFIVLPNVIANYLFDTKEDENMAMIVKNIQEYDKEIRNKL